MSLEANKELVRRYIEEVHNQGKMEVLDEVLDPHFAVLSLAGRMEVGIEQMKAFSTYRRAAIPDFHVVIDEVIAEGDKVVVRGHESGTQVGEYGFGEMFHFPPSGKRFTVSWIDIYTIANGKIVDMWAEMDIDAMKRQLAP